MNSLVSRYDALVCDLDGVVYRGPEPVPHAIESLEAAHGVGVKVAYATNNASRPPAEVAEHLRELGLTLDDGAVVNSSMAGADHLARHLPEGSTVLAIGGEGVRIALQDRGFKVVTGLNHGQPAAVLQGYGPKVAAQDLAHVAYAVQRGARWVATNTDRTLPTAQGTAPGNGALVGAVREAVDVDPEVVGKPGPLMYTMAADRLGTAPERTLGIGDRLETDVAGARAAGMDCLHVLTGVHGPSDLIAAPAELRPRYVAADLRALQADYVEPQHDDSEWRLRRLHAQVDGEGPDATLEVRGAGSADDRLRLSLAVLWEAIDTRMIDRGQAVNLWVSNK